MKSFGHPTFHQHRLVRPEVLKAGKNYRRECVGDRRFDSEIDPTSFPGVGAVRALGVLRSKLRLQIDFAVRFHRRAAVSGRRGVAAIGLITDAAASHDLWIRASKSQSAR